MARTDRVSGWLLVSGDESAPRIEAGCVSIDLATLKSIDEIPGFHTSDRDDIVREFLHVVEHPYAVFQPDPSPIGADVSRGKAVQVEVSGSLEVNGLSKPAKFDLEVQLNNSQVAAAGNTTVAVEDFAIEVPQGADGFVSVDSQITLEISLILLKR